MKNFFKPTTFLLLTVLGITPLLAQDFSNKGKDFWLLYPAHIDGNTSRMALYISANVTTSGSVILNGTTIPFTVTANQATVVQIFPSTYPIINAQNEGVAVGKGIHVIANAPVVVYAHILNAARSGSSLILPTKTLGREYTAISYASVTNANSSAINGSPAGSQLQVVGVENETTIEITPSVSDVGNTHVAGVPFTVKLNQGDVYQFRTTFNKDLTGTKIRSLAVAGQPCKPIAVFSGSAWASMGCTNASSGDNLFQQLTPTTAWGKAYVTAPFADRQFDIFRIVVSDPGTAVVVNGATLPFSQLVNGTYYEFSNAVPNIISADKPIVVVQYMITQNCDTRGNAYPGDPEMIILNPIEQTVNDVTVVSARRDLTPPATNITKHFFTIIMKTAGLASLRIDGNPPTGTFVSIGSSGYAYLHENVTNSTTTNPSHRITADSGFIALAYGLGNVESYGYNAGTNVRDLYQFVSIQNQYATADFPATCINTPFFYSMTFPYEPTQINWEFGGLHPDVLINSPVKDSTWFVNGRQLYRYKLTDAYNVPKSGLYPVKVIAQNPTPDGCGNEQEINFDLQVYERPKSAFGFITSGCLTDAVQFRDSSNPDGRPIAKWSWDFGNGNTSNLQNPAHLFVNGGSYNSKLSIITDVGCVSDTTGQLIKVSPVPVTKFSANGNLCIGKSITFSDQSTATAEFPIVKWTWDFGDGSPIITTATNTPLQHTYATGGTYTIKLNVETSSGCKQGTYSEPLFINNNPVASFSFGNACLPSGAMIFSDASANADTYNWDFGDGGKSTIKNPVHNYTATGPFTATLSVTSPAGCIDDTAIQVNTVYAQPLADFIINKGELCFGEAFNFTDNSSAPGNSVKKWNWSFDDGSTDSKENTTKTFSNNGAHTITLSVTSEVGCVSEPVTKSVMVHALPLSTFSVNSFVCANTAVQFEDRSIANSGSIIRRTWTMGDGSAATDRSAGLFTYKYADAGNYRVMLETQTDKGCISKLLDTVIKVHPQPVTDFVMPGSCLNDPFSPFIDATTITDGTESSFSYAWNFGDPNANASNPNTATSRNPRHKYTATGDYPVALVVTTANGCVASNTKIFTVNGAVPKSAFTVEKERMLCGNTPVSITNNSVVDVGKIIKLEIFWDESDLTQKTTDLNPAPGKVYTTSYPAFFTPTSKSYTIRVRAYSGEICFDEIKQTINVNAIPDIKFNAIPAICGNAPQLNITATASNIGGTGIFSGNGVSSAGLFAPPAAGTGTHTLRYTFTGDNGCTDYKEQNIEVYPVPSVMLSANKTVLEGGTIVLDAKGTGNNLTFNWTPATWLNNASIEQPVATPTDDIKYTLEAMSDVGCAITASVFVKVLKMPAIPNVFTPNGDNINDRWEIPFLDTYAGNTVEVYNRYGQIVYLSKGYSKPWDGTVNGKPVPQGTYYYLINPKNGRKQLSGFVDIIR